MRRVPISLSGRTAETSPMRLHPFLLALLVIVFGNVALSGCARAQSSAQSPIADMTSLLNLRVYDNGSALFETVDVVFAPDEPIRAGVEVRDASGATLQRFEFFPEYRFRDKVFGRLQINGHALWQAPGAGDYSIVFDIGGKPATRFDFSVSASGGDDPFDPATRLRYDGPWRTLGYLARRTYRDTELVDLVVWAGGLDLAPGTQRDQSVARLLRGGALIGHSRESAGHLAEGHFKEATYAFFAPHEARRAHEASPVGMDDLIDGRYEIRVERAADGAPIRRFAFAVKNGVIEPDPHGRLGHTPRDTLLSPRVHRKGGNYAFQDAIWLRSAP